MRRRRSLASLASGAVWVLALLWVAGGLTGGYRLAWTGLLLAGVVVVALGEVLEVDLRGGRTTPVSGAAIFALFVILDPTEVVAVLVPAFLLGLPLRARRLGWGPPFRSSSRRLATTMLALLAFQVLLSIVPAGLGRREALALEAAAMVVAGGLYLVLDTAASAFLIARAQEIPLVPIWRGQVRNRAPLDAAQLSVAALMALSFEVLREFSFFLFLLPLLAARDSFRRFASVHRTYIQTIRALSKVPELAGYAPEGHSVRVAELSVALARALGLSDNEVEEVEFAALLHDVGRISFEDPGEIPESFSGTPQGAQLALRSAAIMGETPYLARVQRIVREQDAPFALEARGTTLVGSRLLKVANAFVELTEGTGPQMAALLALHQIELLAASAYDPGVVGALRRVLRRQGKI